MPHLACHSRPCPAGPRPTTPCPTCQAAPSPDITTIVPTVTTPIMLDPAECLILMESPQWLTRVTPDGPDSCWLWQGKKAGGYGLVYMSLGVWVVAHRVVLTATLGRPITRGMIAGHVCHDEAYARGECAGGAACVHRHCVNPTHLREMTVRENTLAGAGPNTALLLRTHCSRGHPLNGSDAEIAAWGKGRTCNRCARDRRKEDNRLISQAARSLGLPRDEYRRRFGSSVSVARGFIEPLATD